MILKEKNFLKNVMLLLLLTFNSIFFSQYGKNYNKFSIENSFGLNRSNYPLSSNFYNQRILNPTTLNLGIRFMTNEIFGIQASINYNKFKFINSQNKKIYYSNYFRYSLETYVNIFNTFSDKKKFRNTNLFFHTGAGVSILNSARTLKKVNWKNDYSDILINLVFGIKSQFKINKFVSYNINLSVIPHLSQTFTWDMNASAKRPGFDGVIFDFTTGFSWYIGKKIIHFDWKRKNLLIS
jgi:OOP family OmpA-OmpF porin